MKLTNLRFNAGWEVEQLGFAYGILAGCLHIQSIAWKKRQWISGSCILALLALVLGGAYLKYKPIIFWGDYLLKIMLDIAILAFCLTLLSKLKVGNEISRLLGTVSYEIYLLHGVTFTFLMLLDTKEQLNSGLFITSTLLITVLGACMLKVISDKICKAIQKGKMADYSNKYN